MGQGGRRERRDEKEIEEEGEKEWGMSRTWGFMVAVTTGYWDISLCSTRQDTYSRFSGRLEFIRGGRIYEVFLEIGITVYPCSDMFLLSLREGQIYCSRRDRTLS